MFKLSRFSEPQAVFVLLLWLRTATSLLFLLAVLLAVLWPLPSVLPLLNQPLVMMTAAAVLLLNILCFLTQRKSIQNKHIIIVLVLDISAWFSFMLASGAALNPATSYFLVLLAVAALALPAWTSASLAAYMAVLYTLLMQAQPQAHHHALMQWHLWGMWLLFIFNAMILLLVISLLGRMLRQKDRAIAKYKEETQRNEQLIALGTLAANIAHELGTPLSTIHMLVNSLKDELTEQDSVLLTQQIERCRQVLAQLKTIRPEQTQATILYSEAWFERLKQDLLLLKPTAHIEWQCAADLELQISGLLEQAVVALICNAVEAAKQKITVEMKQQDQMLLVDITHDGEAIDATMLEQLGRQVVASSKQGLGMGYYLANASIEQLGGQLQLHNQAGQVRTRIILPEQKVLV